VIKQIHYRLFFALVFSIYLSLSIYFNLQFLEGSNVNYGFSAHDEYLTVREVYSIVQPLSWKHFIMAIISGDKLYYGRLMFYSDALVAFIPYKVFGIAGMVFAIRMFHSLLLMASVWLLGKIFIKNELYRLFFVLISLFCYYSFYFSTVPKPEPHQLFVLALFLKYFWKNGFKPGKYFVLLGLAYGLKFNVLLILPIVMVWVIKNNPLRIKEALKGGFWFLAGLIIAIPCLLLALIRPIFLKTYIGATFLNTTNVDDNPAYGPDNWILSVWPTFYHSGFYSFLFFIIFLIGFIIVVNKLNAKSWFSDSGIFLVLCGFALTLPVVLTTKRLYPHYLWTGQIFLWAGFFYYLGCIKINENIRKLIAFSILISSLSYTFIIFNNMMNREKVAQQLINMTIVQHEHIFNKNPRSIVIQDIGVFFPFEWHVKAKPYHPFAGPNPAGVPQKNILWISELDTAILKESKADYVLLSENMTNRIGQTKIYSDSVWLQHLEANYKRMFNNKKLQVLIRKDLTNN
jgi:hypothetical protein